MCYVNYVRESTVFMRHACDQGLTANERLLWYALFDVMNARAKGCDWPEGLIPIPNKRLLSLVPFGEDSLAAARNKLKQRGLIDYMPGRKNAAPPMYQLNYLTCELSTNTLQAEDSYPYNTGNNRGNMEGNIGGNNRCNMEGDIGGNIGGIIINYKQNRNPDKTYTDDAADAAAADRRAQARREQIAEQFAAAIGRAATPLELHAIGAMQAEYGVSDEVVNQAIGEAGRFGARSPAQYAGELMRTWSARGVRTAYDLVCLQFDGSVPEEG